MTQGEGPEEHVLTVRYIQYLVGPLKCSKKKVDFMFKEVWATLLSIAPHPTPELHEVQVVH